MKAHAGLLLFVRKLELDRKLMGMKNDLETRMLDGSEDD